MLQRSVVLLGVLVAVAALVSGASGAGVAVTPPFPVTVTTAAGKVTLGKAPTRIVSLSASSTESLFAIGAGRQVIAVDDQSDYPKSAPKTTLSGFTPNVEAIAGYKPDLVIASYDPKGLVAALQKLKIPVLVHGAASTLPGAYQQIRQLGRLTGHAAGADRVIARMKTQIAKIVSASKSRAAGLSVYHELTPDFYSASSRRSWARCTPCSASRTSPTPPTRRARGTRSSRRSTSLPRAPT